MRQRDLVSLRHEVNRELEAVTGDCAAQGRAAAESLVDPAGLGPLVGGAVPLIGCLILLIESVCRAARTGTSQAIRRRPPHPSPRDPLWAIGSA